MTTKFVFGTRSTIFVVCAIAITGFGIFTAPRGPVHAAVNTYQPQPWTISITATSSSSKPDKYAVSPPNINTTTCRYSPAPSSTQQPGSGTVYVCPNDTITFVAHTSKGNGELFLYDEDSVVSGGTHILTTPAEQPVTGTVGDYPASTHRYDIAIFDKDARHWHTDDPQIIIGTGQGDDKNALLTDISGHAHHIIALSSSGSAAKEDARQILQEIDALRNLLQTR